MKTQDSYLFEILDSGRIIQSRVQEISKKSFLENETLQDSVAMRFAIIGEAAVHISPETQEKFPDVPFSKIRGLRNRIVHEYGTINAEEMWNTIVGSLPELVRQVEHYFQGKL